MAVFHHTSVFPGEILAEKNVVERGQKGSFPVSFAGFVWVCVCVCFFLGGGVGHYIYMTPTQNMQ